MSKDDKLTLFKVAIFGLGLALCGYLFHKTIGNGILIGLVFGLFHYSIMYIFMSLLLKLNSFRIMWFAVYFLGNIGIFAVPLYIGSVYPDIVNVFGAAFGLAIHNIYVYLNALMQRLRKER